jgi:hypothetical protein
LGLSSIVAFGQADEEELDQADDEVSDLTEDKGVHQADDAASDLKSIQVGKDGGGPKHKVYETMILIGTSEESWEDAVEDAAEEAQMLLKKPGKIQSQKRGPEGGPEISIVEVLDLDARLAEHKDFAPNKEGKPGPKIEVEFIAVVEFSFEPKPMGH